MSNFFNHHTSSSKLPNTRPTIQFDSNSFSNNFSSEAAAVVRSDLGDWSSMSWRKSVEKLFETVEFQQTKSYRAPNNNNNNQSASGIFDQAAQSVDGNGQTAGGASTANERKSSVSRAKASMSQTIGGQSKDSAFFMGSIGGGKQSTSSSHNKPSTANMQKRASIVSLKNNTLP